MSWGALANALCIEELNWAIYLRKLADQIKDSKLKELLLKQAVDEEKHGRMLQSIARIEGCNPRVAKTSRACADWVVYESQRQEYKPFKIEGGRSRRSTLRFLLGNKRLEDYSLDCQIAFVTFVEFLGLIFYSALAAIAPLPLKKVAQQIAQDEKRHVTYFHKKKLLIVFWMGKLFLALPIAAVEIGKIMLKNK